MDITNLISIYGKLTIQECPSCKGVGCETCSGFGFIAVPVNANFIGTFQYPMYIELKKRYQATLRQRVIIGSITLLFIVAIIISYIVNIIHG